MKTACSRSLARLIFTLAAIFAFSSVYAQEQNLLSNPGFENGFTTLQGEQPRNVAIGWTPWNASRTGSMPSFQNVQPKYIAASTASANGVVPRIRSGQDAQIYYSFFETHDGGIYQRVSGITPNTELRFSIYAYVWSTTFENPNLSEDPGGVGVRVGIDPNGGTDPFAASVVYSPPLVAYDAYRQLSVIATAASSTVTVFVRSTVSEPVQYTYIYLDDAVLAATTTQPTVPPPTNTPQPTATNTLEPTATDTVAAPTNTSVPTGEPTQPPTVLPTNTPTATATATTVPTNTPENPTPTPENMGQLPTSTPITIVSTPTAVSSVGGQTPITDQFPGRIVHTVSRGDVVSRIAALYGSTTQAVLQANGLSETSVIFIGQTLIVPVRLANAATETPSPTPPVSPTPNPSATANLGIGGAVVTGTTPYIVQPFDTLFSIAVRFNTTTGALIQLNGITNPNLIFIGQRLLVPTSAPASSTVGTSVTATPTPAQPTTYVVQPGDTLFRIASRFNVNIVTLAQRNNITNYNRIFVGQRLVLP